MGTIMLKALPMKLPQFCGFLFTILISESAFADDEITIEQWMDEASSGLKAVSGTLIISRFKEPVYFLTQPIKWESEDENSSVEAITVPKGFVTDFASVPRIFWTALRPDGDYAYAAVLHDYLYWEQDLSREQADKIMKTVMQEFEVGGITTNLIYTAVRVGGQQAWNENKDAKEAGEHRILSKFPHKPTISWHEWKKRDGVFKDK